jgi:hypothetical protein
VPDPLSDDLIISDDSDDDKVSDDHWPDIFSASYEF